MKKLLLLLALMFLLIPQLSPAADRSCEPIWENVAGQTYVLEIGDQSFDVMFSAAYAGPVPQGRVEIYDGIYIAPCLTCKYTTHGDNLISINCDGGVIPLMLIENMLVVVDPNAPFMTRRVDE